MKVRLGILPKDILAVVKEVALQANKGSFHAYLVGGFVRDLILKRKNFDLDIVVETDAINLARFLSRKKKAKLNLYHRFGTATVIYPSGFKLDLSTARKEKYPYSGALPEVRKGKIKDDLFRRDFSINAMAVCINQKKRGELVDCFGGLKDLKERKVRVLHEASFIDDPTRILRAVRFEQRFAFHLEKRTSRLMKAAIQQGVTHHVKPPRYFQEFRKILKEPGRIHLYIKRLSLLNALDFLGKGFKVDRKTLRYINRASKGIRRFEDSFENKKILDRWIVYFILLLANVRRDKVERIMKRCHFKKEDGLKVLSYWEALDRIKEIPRGTFPPREIYKMFKPLSYESLVALKSVIASRRICALVDRFLLEYDSVVLAISGKDLKRLGISSGAKMGGILKELLYQKVDGCISSRRDELSLAKRLN